MSWNKSSITKCNRFTYLEHILDYSYCSKFYHYSYNFLDIVYVDKFLKQYSFPIIISDSIIIFAL